MCKIERNLCSGQFTQVAPVVLKNSKGISEALTFLSLYLESLIKRGCPVLVVPKDTTIIAALSYLTSREDLLV